MCSVEPREPPPHLTLPGSFFICSTTSFIVFSGEFGRQTKTLYSLVRRAIGVACDRLHRRLAGDDAAEHHGAHHHQRVRVALAGVDELRQAERAGGAALVLVVTDDGDAGILQRLAERAAGGVPAAAGVGGDHHLDVGALRACDERQRAGSGQRGQGLQEGVATHAMSP